MGNQPNQALRFVLLLGLVSLFADVTYEGARSITGPYLSILGAGAAVVGLIAGFGEFIGYGFRVVSGVVSDRTRRYWAVAIAGYAVNLLAVPLLALAGNWPAAAALIVAERLGKAIRNPARDAMLSHASHRLGRGWAFGVHEALDQIGAVLGPLAVAGALAWKGSYRYGFAVLGIPAALALATLAVARVTYPRPRDLEPELRAGEPARLSPAFPLYLAAAACIALGFVDYSLAAYHMKTAAVVADEWIPLLYAGAMGVDAVSALVLGRWYDRKGLPVLWAAVAASAWCAPLVFLSGPWGLMAGMALWGAGMGAQESVLRAVVAELVPRDRRATGYGVFNAGFGLAWFAGSALMGLLYERSKIALAAFSVAAQLASLPLLYAVHRRLRLIR